MTMRARALALLGGFACAAPTESDTDGESSGGASSQGTVDASADDDDAVDDDADDDGPDPATSSASASSDDADVSEGDDSSTGVPPIDGWCTQGDTVLSSAIAGLQPRSWAELPASESVAGLDMAYSLLYWNDSAVWDPDARQVHWIGGPGTCCADPATFQRMTYDVATDTWSMEATPFTGSGHAYDGNAFDPTIGTHYFALFSDPIVKTFDGSTWGELPELPWSTEPAVGMTWFADRGELVFVDGFGELAHFDGSSWVEIAGAEAAPWGSYNLFAEYNPVHGTVWLGAGNDGDRVSYVLDADLQLTRSVDAPVSLNNGPSIKAVDPVSGNHLIHYEGEDGSSWWEYDPVADVFTEIVDMQNAPDFGESSEFHVPIAECGVIFVFAHYYDERRTFVYRHG